MMRGPGSLANVPLAALAGPADLPEIDGLNLELAAENVRRHGGDPGRFATALLAGVSEGVPADRAHVSALVSLAGWRAGALPLRDDALARANAVTDTAVRTAITRVLGIDTDLESFLHRQKADRFWWPDRDAHRGYVCTLGGFSGLGGLWISPPQEARRFAEPGAFAIRAGDDWWRADVDVWGARLVQIGTPPVEGVQANDAASIVLVPDSYLAWVHVGMAL